MTSTWSGECSAQHLLIITGFDCLMLARTGGGLIKGRNSVHLQACAAKKLPNISCMISCNINRRTYIRLQDLSESALPRSLPRNLSR